MGADRAYYFDRLYPVQDGVLAILRELETEFYLTGGTAASRGYLHHRFSDDLDFFVNDDHRFGLWASRFVVALAKRPGWRVDVLVREERFLRVNIGTDDVQLKLELVNDAPSRVGTVQAHPTLFRLDTAENILANKVTALIDRREPKDFADVWGFCCLHDLSLQSALAGAQGKAAGVFAPDVARVLIQAKPEDWRLVRWIDEPAAERYLAELRSLGERLLLAP